MKKLVKNYIYNLIYQVFLVIVPLITAVSNPNKNPPNAAIIEIYITDFNCAVDFILFSSSLFT